MDRIYTENLKLKSEQIVLKSTFTSDGEYEHYHIEAEKPFDLYNEEDRDALLARMAIAILNKHSDASLEILVTEAQKAVDELWEKLPL